MPKVELDDNGQFVNVRLNGRIMASISGDMRQQAAAAFASTLLCNPTATQSEVSDHPNGIRYEQQWDR